MRSAELRLVRALAAGLLVFMIVASKGAAGVTGAGLATLAGGLQSHRPGSWTKTIDRDRVNAVLRGDDPFDELTMVDDHAPRAEEPAQERVPAPA